MFFPTASLKTEFCFFLLPTSKTELHLKTEFCFFTANIENRILFYDSIFNTGTENRIAKQN